MAEFVAWPVGKPLFLHHWKRLKTSPNLDGIIPWPAELRVCQHLLQDLEAFTTWGGLWFYDDSYNPVNASICIILTCHLVSCLHTTQFVSPAKRWASNDWRVVFQTPRREFVHFLQSDQAQHSPGHESRYWASFLVIDVLTLIDLLKDRERKREGKNIQVLSGSNLHSQRRQLIRLQTCGIAI